ATSPTRRGREAAGHVASLLIHPLARGVTVARLTLDQLVLVRIQAGQHGKAACWRPHLPPSRRRESARSDLRRRPIVGLSLVWASPGALPDSGSLGDTIGPSEGCLARLAVAQRYRDDPENGQIAAMAGAARPARPQGRRCGRVPLARHAAG